MSLASFKRIFDRSPTVIHFKINFPLPISRIELCLQKLHKVSKSKPAAVAISLNGMANSPEQGHTLYQAFFHSVQKFKIPIYSFIEDNATSLTYLTANCSDKIIANPYCMIGEVGTTFKNYRNIKKLLDYLGIKVEWLGQKEQLVWNRLAQPNEYEKKFTDNWISTVEETLIKVVSRRRNIPIETVRKIKNKLYTPEQAKKQRLIDEINTFQQYAKEHFPFDYISEHIIADNVEYSPQDFLQQDQLNVLNQIQSVLMMPKVGLFSMQDPLIQPLKNLFLMIENRLGNVEQLDRLDKFIGKMLNTYQNKLASNFQVRI